MGHGAKGGEVGPGGGKGVGAAHGLSNGLATALGRAIGLVAKAPGRSNGPEMSKGDGNGTTHGRGFGFGHASIGNPGHNALSGRSSHSQNTSHRGGTPDGRSFSNHTHAEHSLAQDHVAHTTKADQAVQVDDQGPGKAKGFVDSLPSNQELQADRSVTLNPNTIHSSLDNDVAIGFQPNQEPNVDRGRTLNLVTIHSDPNDIVTLGLPPGQELQADRDGTLNLETIHSDLDDIVTRGLPPSFELNLDRGESLPASWQAKVVPGTIVPDTDDTPATALPHRWELGDDRAWVLPSTKPELDDDADVNLVWRLVFYFGAALLFFLRIVQGSTWREKGQSG
jgi:hypothetical protein